MAAPTTIKTEGGFPYPMYNPRARPEFRRPFSDGSMTIHTSDLQLAASLPSPQQTFMNTFQYDQHASFFQPSQSYDYLMSSMSASMPVPITAPPPIVSTDERSRSLSRGSTGKVKPPRSRSGRKGSMSDVKPAVGRIRTASSRAMSYNHDGRHGLGLDTHLEHQRTNSVTPPDYAYGVAVGAPPSWNGSGSLQSMQSFGTTIDEAVLDSPISPSLQLPPLPPDASEETRKQRRRECHNLVEKRRREHINTKIDELAGLLPPQYQQADEVMEHEEEDEDAGSPKNKKKIRRNSMAKQKETGTCKGRILTHSVQYIHDLRQVNNLQATRIQQLEALLGAAAGSNYAAPPSLIQQTQTFYEPAGLEPLRPSPEPETFSHDWNAFNPVFEESPDSFDSGSMMAEPNQAQPQVQVQQQQQQNHQTPHPHSQMQGHRRQDSSMGLQMGMTGLELDAVFSAGAGGRREEDMGMRW